VPEVAIDNSVQKPMKNERKHTVIEISSPTPVFNDPEPVIGAALEEDQDPEL